MKVLMNAEAFGFGPSASIAAMFPTLRDIPFISELSYAGHGHTIDLQKNLTYDKLYNVSEEKEFKSIVKHYDVFITALDFEKAFWAQEMGIKTIIYDTLLWYWRKIPPVIFSCHSYLVQNFYTVEDKIKELNIINAHVIPPLIEPKNKSHGNTTIINFGGLENPHWSIEVTLNYIHNTLSCLLPLLKGPNIKIFCSQSHAQYLQKYNAQTCDYFQMQKYLQECDLLIATPGLGNLYESASYQVKSLFLLPANDSQGQQMAILRAKGLLSNSIDWQDLNHTIDYLPHQSEVLTEIEHHILNFNRTKFSHVLKEKLKSTENQLAPFLNEFGSHGKDYLCAKMIEVLTNIYEH